ncbi:MAG TPA: DUF4397 domain-containing protein [Vicinamibacterales bacterium]|nr:DUF4397 domain-containing protein [Vicinamibacterales bacterium]
MATTKDERTHLTRRTIGYVGCLVVLPAILAGCQQESTRDAPVSTRSPAGQSTAPAASAAASREVALVRVVHAIPADSTVDLFADDNKVFEGLAYKVVTPYREMDGQRYTFRLRPAGMDQAEALASNTEGLSDGNYYTVFAVPGDGEAASLRVVVDTHALPSAGKARLRVVHASNDAGEVDVYAVGRTQVLFDSVNFQSVTDYTEFDPITGALELRPDGDSNVMLTVPNVRLDASKTYTFVIVGRVRTAPKLETFVIEDQAIAAAAQ